MRADRSPPTSPPSSRRVRLQGPLPLVGPADPREERLIRSLALDRLRDLHDDGVTIDYIGRMYGVSGERIASIERHLRS